MFLVIGGLNLNQKPDHKWALILNDTILLLIFVISCVNIVISGFGLTDTGIIGTRKYY